MENAVSRSIDMIEKVANLTGVCVPIDVELYEDLIHSNHVTSYKWQKRWQDIVLALLTINFEDVNSPVEMPELLHYGMQTLRRPPFFLQTTRLPVLAKAPWVECCVLVANEWLAQRRVKSVYLTAHKLMNASLEFNLVIAPH